MSEEEILSPEEVDALTSDADEQDAEEIALDGEGKVMAYDFMRPAHTRRGYFPTLEIINERITKCLQSRFCEMLQDKVEVIAGDVEFIKYGEFTASLPLPVDVKKLYISRLKGHMLVCFGTELLDTIIEKYFGSPSIPAEYVAREEKQEFTQAEKKISMKILNHVTAGFEEGWSYIAKLQFSHVQSESNPRMVTIADSSELVVKTEFHIDIGEHRVNFVTAIPYKILDKVKHKLRTVVRNVSSGKDRIWINRVFNRLHRVPVEVVGKLGTTTLSVERLMNLNDGDVVPMNKPEFVTLYSNDVPLFTGHLGESKGQAAIQVVSKIGLDD